MKVYNRMCKGNYILDCTNRSERHSRRFRRRIEVWPSPKSPPRRGLRAASGNIGLLTVGTSKYIIAKENYEFSRNKTSELANVQS